MDAEEAAAAAPAAAMVLDAWAENRPDPWQACSLTILQAVADRLDRPSLVDLLKHPRCVGEAQAWVLRRLVRRAGR